MKLKVLLQSDWGIGGNGAPGEMEFMEKFVNCDEALLESVQDSFALSCMGFDILHARKEEVGYTLGTKLQYLIDTQVYGRTCHETPVTADVVQALRENWNSERFDVYKTFQGMVICYKHTVSGDCGDTWFTIEE